jgi:NADH-quinone oxidoreductase subunit J
VSLAVIVFGVMFIVALGASLAMLFSPNAVHVALFLVVAQVALALAFLLQGAYFVAAMQIIVYAGAIMVLFLFVIMLLGVDKREALIEPLRGQRQVAIGLGLLLAAEISYSVLRGVHLLGLGNGGSAALNAINQNPGNVKAIARLLFSRYLLPFEATSVLLVVAIVGVMMLARRIDTAAGLFEPRQPAEPSAPIEAEREAV